MASVFNKLFIDKSFKIFVDFVSFVGRISTAKEREILINIINVGFLLNKHVALSL